MKQIEKIKELSIQNQKDLRGKKVLLRIDFNVPLGENGVVDPGEDWRIQKAFDTLSFLRAAGACVIVLAHLGRDPKASLKPIVEYLNQTMSVGFLPRYDHQMIEETLSAMKHGSIVVMENLRQHSGEQENDSSYLDTLINLCDVYVNDAFSVSHRKHASICDITKKLPSYFGIQFIREVEYLNKFLAHVDGVKTLVLGGAKFDTKFDLLEKFLPRLDYVLMGGALANVFLKARGFKIGASFCDDIDVSHMVHNDKILLPIDYIDEHGDVADIYDVADENMILDIGPATIDLFEKIIDHSAAVMWNGPMGKYEDSYTEGSIQIADSISRSMAFSVTGGGDTSAVVLEAGLVDNFDFISTGGGAMLDYLIDETLPGIDVILKK